MNEFIEKDKFHFRWFKNSVIKIEKAAPSSLATNHLYRNPSPSHRDLWFTGYLSFFERCSIFEWRFDASEFTKFHVLNVVPPIISKKRQSINPLISPNWPWLGLTLFLVSIFHVSVPLGTLAVSIFGGRMLESSFGLTEVLGGGRLGGGCSDGQDED